MNHINGPDLNITYYNQEYHHNTRTVPISIAPLQQQQQQQYPACCSYLHPRSPFNIPNFSISPPSSIASSLSSSQGSSYHTPQQQQHKQVSSPITSTFLPVPSLTSSTFSQPTTTTSSNTSNSNSSPWNFTWLVFMNEKWIPFDLINQTKLEQTLTVGGTFVDIVDSHFPDVRKVRVFPKNNYLSYLGVKYRLSRIMQPDAYLDHIGMIHPSNSGNSPSSKPQP